MKTLIVEDHLRELARMDTELRLLGLVPFCAGSAREARHALAERPDILLCDLCLSRRAPKPEGLDVIKECRRRYPGCYIIAWSVDRRLKDDAIDAGANVFLDKNDGGSLVQNIKMSALQVEHLVQHATNQHGILPPDEPFNSNACHAIRYILVWLVLPFLVTLGLVASFLVTGYRLPFAPRVFTLELPLPLCLLFFATWTVWAGKREPVVRNWKAFDAFLSARKAVRTAAVTAIIAGAYYDLIKEMVVYLLGSLYR